MLSGETISSQFGTLHRECEGLRNVTAKYERSRKHEEDLGARHRNDHSTLLSSTRSAHSKRGVVNKNLSMAKQKKFATLKEMDNERSELAEIVQKIDAGLNTERRCKRKFIREMEGVNNALSAAMREHDDRHAYSLVGEENIQFLLRRLESDSAADPRGGEPSDGDGGTDGDGTGDVLRRMVEGLAEFRCATSAWNGAVAEQATLEGRCSELRLQATSGDGEMEQMGEMELDELERLWEQPRWDTGDEGGEQHNNPSTEENDQPDQSMELFYDE